MTPEEALEFVRERGVVLASARGPVPRLAEHVAGEPIRGSWWGHEKGREIFRILSALADSPDILVCRIVGGKISFVHRRLWPALVRAARFFPPEHLARVEEEHTAAGHHVRREQPFPDWVDAESRLQAGLLGEEEALNALGDWARPRAARAGKA